MQVRYGSSLQPLHHLDEGLRSRNTVVQRRWRSLRWHEICDASEARAHWRMMVLALGLLN